MAKRLFKIFFVLAGPFLLIAILMAVYLATPVAPADQRINIAKGMGLLDISHALAEQRIIHYPIMFVAYVQITRKGSYLQAGEYLFEEKNTPRQVLDQLTHGKILLIKARIVEGWTLRQILAHLKGLPLKKDPDFEEEFLRLAYDKNFIGSLGLDTPSLEGYLFPETYHLSSYLKPNELLKIFVDEFKKQNISPTNLSLHQIVTLASMIEKETNKAEERPLIASVFYNRLAKSMLLQSDPTIIYGLKNFDGNIKKEDILNPHPYNTYVHPGLPPGPICNPGLASLNAAMHPAETNYLYFVSKNDGTHHFSVTAEEHAEAVKLFQLQSSQNGKPKNR